MWKKADGSVFMNCTNTKFEIYKMVQQQRQQQQPPPDSLIDAWASSSGTVGGFGGLGCLSDFVPESKSR